MKRLLFVFLLIYTTHSFEFSKINIYLFNRTIKQRLLIHLISSLC